MKKLALVLVLCVMNFFAMGQTTDSITSKITSDLKIERKTAYILSSNFTIPSVQYQPYNDAYKSKNTLEGSYGKVSFFNSIGAGLAINRANYKEITSKGDTSGFDVNNQAGFQAGFLFSRTSVDNKDISRFAFHTGISIMDFQIGYGVELGELSKDLKKRFFTISYSVPMSKITRNNGHVFKNGGGMNDHLTPVTKGHSL